MRFNNLIVKNMGAIVKNMGAIVKPVPVEPGETSPIKSYDGLWYSR